MAINAVFPTFNLLAVLFILLPSTWHWRARNTPTLLLIFWLLAAVLPQAINSIVWFNTADDIAPIWCDITTKLRVGADVGVAAASVCLMRQLESIAAARQIHYSASDRRRQKFVDLAIGVGLPTLIMILHVVVQGHRYDILQRVGCIAAVYWSYPAVFLVTIWPPFLLTVAAVYGALALRLFLARRYQFAKLLESSKSAITLSRFIRLIALASLQIAFSLPILILILVRNIQSNHLQPYSSWSEVHFGFNYIGSATYEQWTSGKRSDVQITELGYWLPIVIASFFFLFFGLGEESLAAYRAWWSSALSLLHIRHEDRPPATPSATQTHISLPPYPQSATSDVEIAKSSRENLAYGGVVVTIEKENYSSV